MKIIGLSLILLCATSLVNATERYETSKCTANIKESAFFTLDKYGYCKDKRQFCLLEGEPYQIGASSPLNSKLRCLVRGFDPMTTKHPIAMWMLQK
jgi:hypothetical protein